MSHAQTYQMMWPDQLSQVKEKAKHSNVSQEGKIMTLKIIMTEQKPNTTHALSRSIQHDCSLNRSYALQYITTCIRAFLKTSCFGPKWEYLINNQLHFFLHL